MVAISSGLSRAPRTRLVKAMVAVATTEVGLVLLSLERGNIREKRREMVGVEMGDRNLLAHSGFMRNKRIVSRPKG